MKLLFGFALALCRTPTLPAGSQEQPPLGPLTWFLWALGLPYGIFGLSMGPIDL